MKDEKITQGAANQNTIFVTCPSCKASLKIASNPPEFTCPVCGNHYTAKKKERLRKPRYTEESLLKKLATADASSVVSENIKPAPKKKFLDKIYFEKWKGWVYLLPVLVLIAVFTVWPIFNTVRIAFLEGYSNLGEIGGETYSFGFGNFVDVVKYDTEFSTAMKNTLLLCVLTVPLSTAIALLIAVCLKLVISFLHNY